MNNVRVSDECCQHVRKRTLSSCQMNIVRVKFFLVKFFGGSVFEMMSDNQKLSVIDDSVGVAQVDLSNFASQFFQTIVLSLLFLFQ